MISKRSILSLCQYLDLQDAPTIEILLEKHGINLSAQSGPLIQYVRLLLVRVVEADNARAYNLLEEVVRTRVYFRDKVDGWPGFQGDIHDIRFDDLIRCLQLDGYTIINGTLTPLDPTIPASATVDDDLSKELSQSGLAEAGDIIQALKSSEEAFRRVPPDYNACLTHARVGLQTLAKAIALQRQQNHPGSFDPTSWGQVLAYLRTSGLITTQEEDGLSGVFTFVSPGAHSHIGLNNMEMTRLGRSLAASMCYFLIKNHNSACP